MREIVCAVALCLAVAAPQPVEAASRELETRRIGASLRVERPVPITEGVLTVQGKGVSLRIPVTDLEDVRLPAADADGKPLPDGVYRYELKAMPKRSVVEREADAPLRTAGSYRVAFGTVATTAAAPPRKIGANQQINDDLYVAGRGCIGPACVTGKSWGLEDLQVSSSFPWVRFDDTHVSTDGFPYHDWQLHINDSADSGLDRFSIEDLTSNTIPFTVEGSAPNDSLWVAANGYVGIGTSTPGDPLHVDGAIRMSAMFGIGGWRLEPSSNLEIHSQGLFSSTIPFFITSLAPSFSLSVAANGAVGMGTMTPTDRLTIYDDQNANSLMAIQNPNSGASAAAVLRAKSNAATVNFQAHGNGRTISRFGTPLASWNEFLAVEGNGLAIGTLGSVPLVLGTSGANRIRILGNGNVGIGGVTTPSHPLQMASGAHVTAGGVWTNASSRELKTNISELSAEDAANAVRALRPVVYEYTAEQGEAYAGFIAEEVPELVAMKDRKSLSAMDVVAVLTKVTQEQQKQIEALAAEVAALRAQMGK